MKKSLLSQFSSISKTTQLAKLGLKIGRDLPDFLEIMTAPAQKVYSLFSFFSFFSSLFHS